MHKLFVIFVAVFSIGACQRKVSIVDKAEMQLGISLERELVKDFKRVTGLNIQNQKIIYDNDSICLLQFTAEFEDGQNQAHSIDYRYIFLIDVFQSRSLGKVVYGESLRKVPCMPDDLIEKCRKDVLRSGESVYDGFIGSTKPIY